MFGVGWLGPGTVLEELELVVPLMDPTGVTVETEPSSASVQLPTTARETAKGETSRKRFIEISGGGKVGRGKEAQVPGKVRLSPP